MAQHQTKQVTLPRKRIPGHPPGARPGCAFPWHCKLALGTWDVTLLVEKESEIVCEVERYKVDIVRLTSTHSVGSGTKLLGPHVQRCVRTKKWCAHLFTSTIRCIKSEMTVEMCGASRQLQGWRAHFSTAVDFLATLRGDVGKLL